MRMQDTVYLMRVGEFLKVGMTRNLAARCVALTDCGARPSVLRTWLIGDDAATVESIALGRLRLHRVKGREYFETDEATAVAAIEKAVSMWSRCSDEPRMAAMFAERRLQYSRTEALRSVGRTKRDIEFSAVAAENRARRDARKRTTPEVKMEVKMTPEVIAQARASLLGGKTVREVALDLNVSRQSIYSRVGSREVRELRRKAKAAAAKKSA